MTLDDLSRARELLRDPDAEDCERFSSRYGAGLVDIAARVLDEGAVEGLARKIHAEACGSDPDELIHHPAQKSWEDPNMPRWEQWRETAETILAYLKGEVE